MALAGLAVDGEEDAGVQLRPVVRGEPLVAVRIAVGNVGGGRGRGQQEEGGEGGEEQAHGAWNVVRCADLRLAGTLQTARLQDLLQLQGFRRVTR
jgi:hypothetical protein